MEDREFERALERWASAPAWDEEAVARIEGHGDALARPTVARRWWPAAAGGLLAASLAALWWVRPVAEPPAVPAAGGDPAASFALLYTPTSEEEGLF
jgi:hypothetical protein